MNLRLYLYKRYKNNEIFISYENFIRSYFLAIMPASSAMTPMAILIKASQRGSMLTKVTIGRAPNTPIASTSIPTIINTVLLPIALSFL